MLVHHPASLKTGNAAHGARKLLSNVRTAVGAPVRWFGQRQATDRWRALNDAQLRDLGIRRTDIEMAVALSTCLRPQTDQCSCDRNRQTARAA